MYGQQARTGVPELDAVLATAKMVTPDQKTPTVAAHVAQAAVQKLMPQGIAQGMNQVRQDVQAAMPSVARNAQEAQMRQALQLAMQPKPVGIEGLQSNIRMAEGGVVGYSGEGPSFVAPQKRPDETFEEFRQRTITEQEAVQQKRRDAARAKAEEERVAEMTRRGMAPRSPFSQTPPAPTPQAPIPEGSDRRLDIPAGGIVSPGMAQATPPTAPQTPAPRPPAQRPPAPAPAAPQAGIAQLVAPTPEGAMASARSVLGLPGTEGLRTKEDAYLAALKAQPATGQQGLAALQAQQAALQAQQADLQRMHDKAEKESNINSVIQQLLGRGEGPGGAARASIAFSEREAARRKNHIELQKTYSELEVANATKRDAIIDLQNAREVGNAKAALEAEQRIRAADIKIAEIEGNLAASFASSSANVYGTLMQAETAAANRASNERIARIQAAARDNPGGREAMAVARVQQAINSSPMLKSLAEKAKFDPTAAAQYAAEEARLYQQLAPELLQNRPAPAPSAALKYNPATGKIE
jgi:hypothetical protein